MTYEVGYGKPPKKNQFQPGHFPHNKGKRRALARDSGESTELWNLVEKAKSRKVSVKKNGRTIKVPGLEALVDQTLLDGLRGDFKSREQFFKLVEKADLAALNGQASEHIRITIEGGLPDE